MASRDSANINYAATTEDEKAAFLDYVRRAKPTTAVIMSGPGFAKQVHDAGGGQTLAIYRRYGDPEKGWDEGSLWRTRSPESYAAFVTDNYTLSKDVLVYVLNEPWCEPHEIKTMGAWVIRTTQILIDAGYRVVAFNLGPGTVQPWHIEEGHWDDVIRAFSRWSNHKDANGNWRPKAFFGMHEYTGFLLPFGLGYIPTEALSDRANVQEDRWPRDIRVAKVPPHKVDGRDTTYPKYWHIDRGPAWFQLRAIDIGVEMFYIILTEFGLDRMPDMTLAMPNIYEIMSQRYGTNGHSVMRGPDSYAGVYRYYWPNKSFPKALYDQSRYVNDYVYNKYVIGWTWFTISRAPDWDGLFGFNLGAHPEFWNLLIQNPTRPPSLPAPAPSLPPITTLQDPLPDTDPRWKTGKARALAADANINIRLAPTTSNNTPIGALPDTDTQVRLAVVADEKGWGQIKFGNLHGWIYLPLISFIEEAPKPMEGLRAILRVDGLRLRTTPDGTIIRPYGDGNLLTYYPESEVSSAGYQWVKVEIGGMSGYMARVKPTWADQFQPLPVPSGDEFFLYIPFEWDAFITGKFGDGGRSYGAHEGVDFAPVIKNLPRYPVRAAQTGVVSKVAYNATGYGYYVRIDHPQPDGTKYVTWYGHLAKDTIAVKEGDKVLIGQHIGDAGSTGNSTGLHLHLTLQKIPGGLPNFVVADVIDPLPLIYYRLPAQKPEPEPEPEPSPDILRLIEVTANLAKAVEQANTAVARLTLALAGLKEAQREADEYLTIIEELTERAE